MIRIVHSGSWIRTHFGSRAQKSIRIISSGPTTLKQSAIISRDKYLQNLYLQYSQTNKEHINEPLNFRLFAEAEQTSSGSGDEEQSDRDAGHTDDAGSRPDTPAEDELSTAGPLQDLLERARVDIGNGVLTARLTGTMTTRY
jgi:hypothetical protein